MAGFAERMGHRAERTLVQSDDLDDETRTELWNVLVILRNVFIEMRSSLYVEDNTENNVMDAVWAWEFKQPRDEKRFNTEVWERIKTHIRTGEWFDVLDLIEAVVKYLDRYKTSRTSNLSSTFVDAFNNRFEHYLVGYRFIGMELTPVDSSAEADAIVAAQEATDEIAGARQGLLHG